MGFWTRFVKRWLPDKHQRDLRALWPLVREVNRLEEQYQSLSDAQLQAKTPEFRARLASGESTDDLMCEAFAVVKNACRRLVGTRYPVVGHEMVWDMVPFDEQILGAIVLHQGKIAEMATGEGKTLVATMPLYLNALTGHNVHLVTHNDYLARRDAQWMGRVFQFLGISVGCIQNAMSPEERRQQYACDITYGTCSEFGFDYLRDHGMSYLPEHIVQRGYHYAIVDEVDSLLIDEARTPLIISGPAPASGHQYHALKPKVEELVRKQRLLCNRLMDEAREALDRGDKETAQLRLYQVHQGMPKHKQLMHLLENPDVRRLLEQIENAMLTDMRKDQARELRQELYFTIDERGHDATLTEKGCAELNPEDPDSYVLPDLVATMAEIDADRSLSEQDKARRRHEAQTRFAERSEMIHNVDQLIRAYCLYERDVEYVVQDNQVIIVDEFTGRLMPGRRWSDGLHQAVEAKEGVRIERETQTLATITIQNYFRLYRKLAGMTGTAETEAAEFRDIYHLDVVVIPTHRPCRRVDFNDVVYKTQREKYKAIIEEIAACHERGQPVLVGTASVETSELLSRMLTRAKIPHNVLNAKNHEREADIVARAGQRGAVTIATNMAGRGTDIKLGEGVVYLDRAIIESNRTLDDRVNGRTLRQMLEERPCGLFVIGSERHEARRIDRQLRGRCARQGDPGCSRFYVSLEDDLMRLFGSDRIANIMSRLGLEEGQQLEHRWLNRSIETAQKRVEEQNFAIRKRTLEYDDVMNKQREIIYGFRGDIVRSENVREIVYDVLHDVVLSQAEALIPDGREEQMREFLDWLLSAFPVAVQASDVQSRLNDREALGEFVFDKVRTAYDLKVSLENPEAVARMERHILLGTIDARWQEYLRSMDALRQGVGLRAYGQRDPLVEYKREAFTMFADLMNDIKLEIASALFRTTTAVPSLESIMARLPRRTVHDEVSLLAAARRAAHAAPPRGVPGDSGPAMDLSDEVLAAAVEAGAAAPGRRSQPKVGRNDPCPCGSGKKYKKCCGA